MALRVRQALRALKERLEQLAQQAQLVLVAQLGRKDRKATKARQDPPVQLVPLVQHQRLPVQLGQQGRLVLPVRHHLLLVRLVRQVQRVQQVQLVLFTQQAVAQIRFSMKTAKLSQPVIQSQLVKTL
jgi:hypothetical protein